MEKEPMDLKQLDFSLKTAFCLLIVFSVSTFGQKLCSAPLTVDFNENNTIDAVVTTITTEEGVSLIIINNPDDAFGLNGTVLIAKKVLDYENIIDTTLRVSIECSKEGERTETLFVFVVVVDINDNPPVFAQSQYELELDELSPVGTTVGRIEATDLDSNYLYYQFTSPTDEFELKSNIDPDIVVKKVLDYDKIQEVNLILTAQDTPLMSSEQYSYTATTSIKVFIIDINNRPPWFQPCSESTNSLTTICLCSGYRGTVNLTEQMSGALPLEPGPVYAIDGDKGRNEPIGYQILAGNENDIFSIDINSGDITMNSPMNVGGPIVLTVMAFETEKPDMFATNTVTIEVVLKSNNPPEFVKPTYEGFISEDADIGSLVLESKTSNKPIQVQVTDADFVDGVNPNIKLEVPEGSAFRVTQEGFILMTSKVPPGITELQMRVVDTTNGEFSTASLSVEVTPGDPTTTTEMPTSTITTDMITDTAKTTALITDTAITTNTITGISKTTNMVTGLTESTSLPETITTLPSTSDSPQTDGFLQPIDGYKAEDMAALGASLAVLLLLCLVIIGVLVYNIKRQKSDWKKLSEASVFRSKLSGTSAGPKDGVQYTNDGFQDNGDTGSVTSKEAAEQPLPMGLRLSRSVLEQPVNQKSSTTLQSRNSHDSGAPPADSSSLSASDNTDNEKEVKPILTKERRAEDGYKAVWFKQDIDPNVKEEVVIIPENGERDISHDDDDDDDEEEEEEEEEERNGYSAQQMGSDSEDGEKSSSSL